MGGFLGIGGSSSKTDRKTTLTGFGDLQNIFNFGLDTSKSLGTTGQQTVGQGVNALGSSLNYFQKLMSGDRSVVSQAVAPETNAVQAQADAARRGQVASGTARGGGTASTNQTAQDKAMAEIDNFLFGARPSAAQQVSDIGGKLSSVGLGETQAALGFADLSEKGAADMTKISADSRATDYAINQDTVNQVANQIGDILGMIF